MSDVNNVVKFPGHKRMRCVSVWCSGKCDLCNLYVCATCGGAEASLPTHCPGERMDQLIEASVQDGSVDYRDGEWKFKCWDDGPATTERTRT